MTLLLIVLIALQIADGVTTYAVLKHGGREINPLARWAMDRVGVVPTILALKGLGAGLIVWLSTLSTGVYWLLAILPIYVWVVYNNARVYRRLTKDRT